eukprot:CAMPEP_0115754906 /NCGR_PEP_ID=MMETSP0272-20121206/97111_1 /TAXON_ID=71861 /ORGANISM="Scrippsiella trochoidea, Strain CCMP3099" /LENGTH=53 /DNA_ID=CAMNT_0003200327 /DNA_START=337 /DNA_END=498 /DNA_ORIENTATION=-
MSSAPLPDVLAARPVPPMALPPRALSEPETDTGCSSMWCAPSSSSNPRAAGGS